MRRYTVILPFVIVLLAIILVLTTVQPAKAHWYWWEDDGIGVIDVCRDGMYFALGWSGSVEDEIPSAAVTASRVSTGEVLFSISEEIPKQEVPYPGPFTSTSYYKYYVIQWQDGNLLLDPGEEVDVQIDELFTVQDCSVMPDEPTARTAFSYQGALFDDDAPADGIYDLQFTLWNAATGGTMVVEPMSVRDVAVENGLFTVELDLGHEAFTGRARWLATGVRPGSSAGAYTPLNPRQEILSVPYAASLVAGAVISDSVPGPGLAVHNNLGNALEVSGGEYGILVGPVTRDSLVIQESGERGIVVNFAGEDGMVVKSPAEDGLKVSNPGNDGIVVNGAGNRGVVVEDASLYGVEIEDGGTDAIRVVTAGDDGIQIGNYPDYPSYGLYIPSPGVNYIGLWPNTASSDGEWALYTTDKILASNITSNGLTQLAQVEDGASLRPSDVVAVTGMTEADSTGNGPVPVVQAADATHTGIVGVVETRLVSQPAAGKENEHVLYSATGEATAGEYVALTVYGVAYVRVEKGSALSPGERLTVAETPGHARPLKTEQINGMLVSESAPTLGIVLDTADAAGLVPVFVTLR